jgi:hypothetical protein
MAASTTSDEGMKPEAQKPRWARVVFFSALFVWNAYFLGSLVYTLWVGHHHLGVPNPVLSLELDSLVVGSLLFLGVGLIFQRVTRRRRPPTVA